MTQAESCAPLISVVVAVMNAGKSLPATLECLSRQSYGDFEVIIADGGSTDNTLAVAHAFEGRLRLQVKSEPDSGIADAWNKGVARSSGKWAIFLNGGDLLHPHHFARAVDLLQSPCPKAVIFCDVLFFAASGKVGRKVVGRPPRAVNLLLGGVGFPHPGSFFSRAALDEVGPFDTALRIAMDTDFILRCVKAGCGFERLASCAYMVEGGVSDVRFRLAMREYFSALVSHGFCSASTGPRLALILPLLRDAKRFAKMALWPTLRWSKHAGMAILNAVEGCLPLHFLRHIFFRVIGFSVPISASIGMGFSFYRPGNLHVGARSVINRHCVIDNRAAVTLGCDVSIARGVHIFTAGHDPDSPLFEMVMTPVTIEDHAVVFAGALIMPGVTIGRGAVVLPGACVTADVPAMAVVGGVPARVIRSRGADPIYQLEYRFPLAM